MEWSGEEIDGLHQALLSAYKRSDLRRLLRTEMDLKLDEVAGGSNDRDVFFSLIEMLEAEDRLCELLEAAKRKNPGNAKLKAFTARSCSELCAEAVNQGPAFEWRGASDDKELQGLLRPRRDIDAYDVAFLKHMSKPAEAVCLIELSGEESEENAIGTGFLIARDLLLTNYHVIAPDKDDDPYAFLDRIMLRFGYLMTPDGRGERGQTFQLAPDPLVKFGTVDQGLDYALLRIEPKILSDQSLEPVRTQTKLPDKDMNIHILQHPEGQTMQAAFSNNGITGVYERDGLIQYVSQTALGSSGSPCFNDNWELVAMHHAQMAANFGGVKCEGILYKAIYEEIMPFLPQSC